MDDLSAPLDLSDYMSSDYLPAADSLIMRSSHRSDSKASHLPDNLSKTRDIAPAPAMTADDRIREAIVQRLREDAYFKGFDIQVESKRCIVVLKGVLGSYDQIACAYRLAVTVPGVKAVYNGLVCNYH